MPPSPGAPEEADPPPREGDTTDAVLAKWMRLVGREEDRRVELASFRRAWHGAVSLRIRLRAAGAYSSLPILQDFLTPNERSHYYANFELPLDTASALLREELARILSGHPAAQGRKDGGEAPAVRVARGALVATDRAEDRTQRRKVASTDPVKVPATGQLGRSEPAREQETRTRP